MKSMLLVYVLHEAKIALPIYPWINKSETFHSEVLICWTIFSFIPLLNFLKLFEETIYNPSFHILQKKYSPAQRFNAFVWAFNVGMNWALLLGLYNCKIKPKLIVTLQYFIASDSLLIYTSWERSEQLHSLIVLFLCLCFVFSFMSVYDLPTNLLLTKF